jgi:hypothetical protein
MITFKSFSMTITFNELRSVKHRLPTGSIKKIATALDIEEQTVRNYFGARKFAEDGMVISHHVEPGPDGGVVHLDRTDILDLAKEMIENSRAKTLA